jgi:phosphatidate cytidylyltransferase
VVTTPAEIPTNGRGLGDLPQRIAVAVPAAAIAVAAVAAGGGPVAVMLAALAVLAAREAVRLLVRGGTSPAVAAAIALVWIGGPLTLAVLLRELDHGGGLVIDVMLAVFLGDTAAHLLGSAFGRRPLAPRVSPNKSVEGFVAGVVVGTAAVVAAAVAFQPWLEAWEAALLGLAVSLAAPAGDLVESAAKRRAGVKDSGTMLGAHGGFLDRLDAVLFGVVAGYVVASALF